MQIVINTPPAKAAHARDKVMNDEQRQQERIAVGEAAPCTRPPGMPVRGSS